MSRWMFFCVLHKKTMIGLLLLLLLFLVRGAVLYTPFLEKAMTPIYRGPQNPKATITVNVDWGEEYIPLMLTIMKEHEIESTFFVTGTFVQKHPQLIHDMIAGGHEVGNHGFEHLHPNSLGREEIQRMMIENERLIFEETGVKTEYFAPPYGEYNDLVLEVAHDLDYKVIMWTVDSIDWQRPGSHVIKERILKGTEKGSIILIHPIQQTVDALAAIIMGIKEQGISLVTLSSLLEE